MFPISSRSQGRIQPLRLGGAKTQFCPGQYQFPYTYHVNGVQFFGEAGKNVFSNKCPFTSPWIRHCPPAVFVTIRTGKGFREGWAAEPHRNYVTPGRAVVEAERRRHWRQCSVFIERTPALGAVSRMCSRIWRMMSTTCQNRYACEHAV